MAEEIQPKFVVMWQARYFPPDVPLWKGPVAALPRDFYFRTKDELDKFMKDHDDQRFYFKVSKTVAVHHDNVYYPFIEQYVFKEVVRTEPVLKSSSSM